MVISMIGMILCGGYGRRLTSHTEDIPKTMIEIKDGHTILDNQLFNFKHSGYIQYEKEKKYFRKNDNIRIKPEIPHSIVALENTLLQEVSTPHPVDTVRIKDKYGR